MMSPCDPTLYVASAYHSEGTAHEERGDTEKAKIHYRSAIAEFKASVLCA